MTATQQKNAKDMSAGALAKLMGLTSGNKMATQTPAAMLAALGLAFVVTGASVGVDAKALIQAQVDAAAAAGGGVVVLPYIGGYSISDKITVSTSNVLIALCDNVTLTKTTKATAFLFTGTNRTTRISNVGIVSVGGRWTIDANGRNITGYTYNTADTDYSAVLFKWCDNWGCRGVYGYNGLVTTLSAFQCGYGVFEDCWASDSVWESGIAVLFDPVATASWSDTDPSTWSNAEVKRCRAFNCLAMYGITSYAATNVLVEDCISYNNGNDNNVAYTYTGGGMSVETDILSAGREQIDWRCKIVRPRIYGCKNAGIFVSAAGTIIQDARIKNIAAPTTWSNAATEKGSGINVSGPGSIVETGSRIEGAGTHGIILLASASNGTNFNPSASIGATIDGPAQHCVYGRGVSELIVRPDAILKNPAAGMGVKVDNSGAALYNPNGGTARLAPRLIENSYDRAINVDSVATVYVAPTSLVNCRSGQGSTGAQINVANATRAMHGDIHNSDANSKTGSIVQIASTCTYGGGSGAVAGNFATSNAAINNLATNKFAPVNGDRQAFALAYAAMITPNLKTMGPHISVGALTSGITVAAAGGGPVAGDRMTLQFVQDGTGGRTITWNAAWKGATLTSSGTASQKARVTFEHDGSNFVQVSSTGWYS